jgi:hypothetical protein
MFDAILHVTVVAMKMFPGLQATATCENGTKGRALTLAFFLGVPSFLYPVLQNGQSKKISSLVILDAVTWTLLSSTFCSDMVVPLRKLVVTTQRRWQASCDLLYVDENWFIMSNTRTIYTSCRNACHLHLVKLANWSVIV